MTTGARTNYSELFVAATLAEATFYLGCSKSDGTVREQSSDPCTFDVCFLMPDVKDTVVKAGDERPAPQVIAICSAHLTAFALVATAEGIVVADTFPVVKV